MAPGVGVGVEHGPDPQPGLGGDGADRFYDDLVGLQRPARQVIAIAENSRCSTRFHLLVPGGRCSTVISRSVSVAKLASSVFYSRSRLPLDPPELAVFSTCRQHSPRRRVVVLAHGVPPAPDRLHRELAGVGVGAQVHPAGVGGHVIHLVGPGLAQLGIGEVVHVGASRRPGRLHSAKPLA